MKLQIEGYMQVYNHKLHLIQVEPINLGQH